MSEGFEILPFYIVCDESGSMAGEPIKAVNDGLVELHREICSNPLVADKARIGILGFSETARVLVHCDDLSNEASLPSCNADGSTNYEAAFRLLRQTIEADVMRFRAEGMRVLRPAVFFMTDGQPNKNNWKAAFDELVGQSFPQRPNIISFGVGAADEAIIRSLATPAAARPQGYAYVAADGVSPGPALREIMTRLIGSIVASTSAATPMLIPPKSDDLDGVILLDEV